VEVHDVRLPFVRLERRVVVVELVEDPGRRLALHPVTQVQQRPRLLRTYPRRGRMNQPIELVLGAAAQVEANDESKHRRAS